jgi:hypothetical protein
MGALMQVVALYALICADCRHLTGSQLVESVRGQGNKHF